MIFKVGDRVRINKEKGFAHGYSPFHSKAFLSEQILIVTQASPVRDSTGRQEITVDGSSWWIGSSDISLVKKPIIIL